jgi:small subunit ribosomal protein S16
VLPLGGFKKERHDTMLAIRMQRLGRKGHAQYRVIVQDSRRTPTSGRVVAKIGSYDPHTKATTIDVELAKRYLDNGAQPSERVARLLQKQGVKMPSWVATTDESTKRSTKNPEKLRKNRPAEEVTAEAPAEAAPDEAGAAESEPAPTADEEKSAE